MSRSDIKRAIARHRVAAAEEAAATLASRGAGTLSYDELERRLRSYILFKYRLTPEEARDGEGRAESGLEALAQLSLDKALKEAPEHAAVETMSATCDGADSTTTKQALLLMAVQEDFDAAFDGFAAAFAETVGDLAKMVWESYGNGSR